MRKRIDKGFQRGHFWELFRTPYCYELHIDSEFWCSCDSRAEAYNELEGAW